MARIQIRKISKGISITIKKPPQRWGGFMLVASVFYGVVAIESGV